MKKIFIGYVPKGESITCDSIEWWNTPRLAMFSKKEMIETQKKIEDPCIFVKRTVTITIKDEEI